MHAFEVVYGDIDCEKAESTGKPLALHKGYHLEHVRRPQATITGTVKEALIFIPGLKSILNGGIVPGERGLDPVSYRYRYQSQRYLTPDERIRGVGGNQTRAADLGDSGGRYSGGERWVWVWSSVYRCGSGKRKRCVFEYRLFGYRYCVG
ncbi:hypothetical protein BDP27DRAFT_1539029 [Rhodocollybia butyracea]|uniref:Uncharacterized protein n=1 Tax=Rhodocollybia butyracea TaxID=206335 RepID=A0A9P5PPI5_9AGAR|nr:hypothetical protein BDP27DRAFT_1539029 [Rhodocollybia butyracea]